MDIQKPISVFISYSNELDKSHKEAVISFTNYLREKGYDARNDEYEKGQETAINFYVMMSQKIQKADKVIIILSEEYKRKADEADDNGVSFEFRRIIPDFESNKNKYILGCLFETEKISKELINKILPFSLNGHEIISLFDEVSLLAKLEEKPIYEFSDVAENKPVFTPKTIKDFHKLNKGKLNKDYDFNNLSIFTRYVFESEKDIYYEIFRTIQVTKFNIPKFQIKPQFTCNSKVKISSYYFPPMELEMDDENRLEFMFPIPEDNKVGDVIFIHYKAEFQDENMESKPFASFRSENDSELEIHEVILKYKNDNHPAILSKMNHESDYNFVPIKEIPFDKSTKTYRIELFKPKVNVTYKLEWKK